MQVISKQGQHFVINAPYAFHLNKIPSCHTLSKALEMSIKTPLTSTVGSQSKDEFISRTIGSNCEIHESPGRKPN